MNDLVLTIFWLNGFFLDAADRLTAGSGLTTARWQVLGAVLHEPLTVAAIARDMGLARQSVQRTANLLVEEGLCEYVPNPAHRRAKLLSATDHGLRLPQTVGPKSDRMVEASAGVGRRRRRRRGEGLRERAHVGAFERRSTTAGRRLTRGHSRSANDLSPRRRRVDQDALQSRDSRLDGERSTARSFIETCNAGPRASV